MPSIRRRAALAADLKQKRLQEAQIADATRSGHLLPARTPGTAEGAQPPAGRSAAPTPSPTPPRHLLTPADLDWSNLTSEGSPAFTPDDFTRDLGISGNSPAATLSASGPNAAGVPAVPVPPSGSPDRPDQATRPDYQDSREPAPGDLHLRVRGRLDDGDQHLPPGHQFPTEPDPLPAPRLRPADAAQEAARGGSEPLSGPGPTGVRAVPAVPAAPGLEPGRPDLDEPRPSAPDDDIYSLATDRPSLSPAELSAAVEHERQRLATAPRDADGLITAALPHITAEQLRWLTFRLETGSDLEACSQSGTSPTDVMAWTASPAFTATLQSALSNKRDGFEQLTTHLLPSGMRALQDLLTTGSNKDKKDALTLLGRFQGLLKDRAARVDPNAVQTLFELLRTPQAIKPTILDVTPKALPKGRSADS